MFMPKKNIGKICTYTRKSAKSRRVPVHCWNGWLGKNVESMNVLRGETCRSSDKVELTKRLALLFGRR